MITLLDALGFDTLWTILKWIVFAVILAVVSIGALGIVWALGYGVLYGITKAVAPNSRLFRRLESAASVNDGPNDDPIVEEISALLIQAIGNGTDTRQAIFSAIQSDPRQFQRVDILRAFEIAEAAGWIKTRKDPHSRIDLYELTPPGTVILDHMTRITEQSPITIGPDGNRVDAATTERKQPDPVSRPHPTP